MRLVDFALLSLIICGIMAILGYPTQAVSFYFGVVYWILITEKYDKDNKRDKNDWVRIEE